MNLLPFNLEQALKHPDRVVFNNGTAPLQWHYFDKRPSRDKILAIDKYSTVRSYGEDGRFSPDGRPSSVTSDLFLLPIPEKRYWANVYKDPDRGICTGYMTYSSEEMARLHISKVEDEYIKTISFTI